MARTRIFSALLLGASIIAQSGCSFNNAEGPTNEQLGDLAVTDGFSLPNTTESSNAGDDDGDFDQNLDDLHTPRTPHTYQTQAEFDQFLSEYMDLERTTGEILKLISSYDGPNVENIRFRTSTEGNTYNLQPIGELSDGILFKGNSANTTAESRASYVVWPKSTDTLFVSDTLNFRLDSVEKY